MIDEKSAHEALAPTAPEDSTAEQRGQPWPREAAAAVASAARCTRRDRSGPGPDAAGVDSKRCNGRARGRSREQERFRLCCERQRLHVGDGAATVAWHPGRRARAKEKHASRRSGIHAAVGGVNTQGAHGQFGKTFTQPCPVRSGIEGPPHTAALRTHIPSIRTRGIDGQCSDGVIRVWCCQLLPTGSRI